MWLRCVCLGESERVSESIQLYMSDSQTASVLRVYAAATTLHTLPLPLPLPPNMSTYI